MTITDQLAAALQQIANCTHPKFRTEEDIDLLYANEKAFGQCINIARTALAAYDARPAASDDVVERVARALARKARVSEMNANGFNGIHLNEYVEMCWVDHKDRARAAIAAMGERDAPGYIPMPRNLDEARAMSLLADAYLRANAPDTKGSGQ